jgi:hypothetical protein
LAAFPFVPHQKGTLFDTPGIVNPNQLTPRLQADELKAVLPRKPLVPVTLSLRSGQWLFLGGLACIELVSCGGESGRVLLTTLVSNHVNVHVTTRPDFRAKRAASLGPPFSLARYAELGLALAAPHELTLRGRGVFQVRLLKHCH